MLGSFLVAFAISALPGEPLPTVAKRIDGLERREGLLSLFVDRPRGRIYLEVPAKLPAGAASLHDGDTVRLIAGADHALAFDAEARALEPRVPVPAAA